MSICWQSDLALYCGIVVSECVADEQHAQFTDAQLHLNGRVMSVALANMSCRDMLIANELIRNPPEHLFWRV